MARTVTEPHGETWKVGRQWAPWRPRLRTPGEDGGGSWLDIPGGLADADDFAVGIVAGLLAVVVFAVLFLVVWPLVAIAIEIVLIALGILVATTGRVLLRMPWTVRAVAGNGRERKWKTVGWGPSGRLVEQIASAIEHGTTLPEGELPPPRVALGRRTA